jgi:hypothetical protein
VDVPVSQQASPSRVELPIPVEISSSSGTQSPPAEAMNSPEMSLPIRPEPSSPPGVQSPASHAETSIPAEVHPSPLQPEAHELPATASIPSHLEASALPRTPSSPVIAPEPSPVPAQEIRHEVLILHSTLLPFLLALLTWQYHFLRIRPHHRQVCQRGTIQLPR